MKKLISALIVFCIMLTALMPCVSASDTPRIILSEPRIGDDGTTADFTVTVENNPGLIGLYILICYDKNAVFTSFTAGEVFSSKEFYGPMGDANAAMRDKSAYNEYSYSTIPDFRDTFDKTEMDPANTAFTIIFAEAKGFENVEGDGRLCDFTLDISNLDDGEHKVCAVCCETNTYTLLENYDLIAVDLGYSNSYIEILPELLPGDIDGDGEVSVKDQKTFKKYFICLVDDDDINFANGDIDCDGEITMKDMKLVKKIILGIL